MHYLNKLAKPLFSLSFIILTFIGYSQSVITDQIKKYSNERYNVQYPGSWVIDTSKRMGTDFVISSLKENDSDKFVENVNLIVQSLNADNIDLDKYGQTSIEQIKMLATDGKIYESEKITTDKAEYYKVIYTMTLGIFKLKIEQYYFIKNGKAYVITFSSELDKFDTFKTISEEILNSFILTK